MYGRRPTLTSLRGMVAAAHPLAAQAGARLLASGGNAFDAAAATAAALNVVEPYMSGFGGMGLAICYVAAEKRLRVLDFVTPIPSKFPVERFKRREELARGALAVGSPGNLAGWHELVSTYGRKPLGEALRPAIELARDGFPLIEFNVAEINETAQLLRAEAALYPEIARTYLAGGASVRVGTILRQPDLASTFEAIAAEGPRHLYGGPLGRAVVAHLAKLGGTLTLGDLEAVAPRLARSDQGLLSRARRAHGAAALRGFPVPAHPAHPGGLCPRRSRARRGRASRYRLPRDPARRLGSHPFEQSGARRACGAPRRRVTSRRCARACATAARSAARPSSGWRRRAAKIRGTRRRSRSRIATATSICLTQSLGSPFGSGVVVPGTGVCLNNFLFWTDVNPESPNRTKPGDALPMCMSPTLSLKEARPVLALGTPGSYGILQTQVQALVQHLDFGLPLQEAIEAPRARLWDRQAHSGREPARRPDGRRAAGARARTRGVRSLDDEGRRHAGRRRRSCDRRIHGRRRSAPRRLRHRAVARGVAPAIAMPHGSAGPKPAILTAQNRISARLSLKIAPFEAACPGAYTSWSQSAIMKTVQP